MTSNEIEKCQGITRNINKALDTLERLCPEDDTVILNFKKNLCEMDYTNGGFTVTITRLSS